MHMFDIIVVSLLIFLSIGGFFRGWIKELFSLFGIVGGVFLGSKLCVAVGKIIAPSVGLIGTSSGAKLLGFCVVFLAVWILSILLAMLFRFLFRNKQMDLADKILGSILSFTKTFLIFSIIFYSLSEIEFVSKKMGPAFEDSATYSLLVKTGSYIIYFYNEMEETPINTDGVDELSTMFTHPFNGGVENQTKTILRRLL